MTDGPICKDHVAGGDAGRAAPLILLVLDPRCIADATQGRGVGGVGLGVNAVFVQGSDDRFGGDCGGADLALGLVTCLLRAVVSLRTMQLFITFFDSACTSWS